nr:hypothetical protein [Tanacetum cinerariifolium]
LARLLGEGFVYQGEATRHGHTRGEPSGHLSPTSFVLFLQNHDQIGNRAFGERLIQLSPPQALQAATALLLLSPMIPMMFMGDEWGASEPFLFFTDFHDELADAVREGRRGEFKDFAAFKDPAKREQIPDPNALKTFEASRPAFDALLLETDKGQDHRNWLALYKQLLEIRRTELFPRLAGAKALGVTELGDKAVSARWQLGDGSELRIDLNLGTEAVSTDDLTASRILYQSQPNSAELSSHGTLNQYTAVVSLKSSLSVDWKDANAKPQRVSPEVLRKVLGGLGYPADTEEEVKASLERLRKDSQPATPPPLITVDQNTPVDLSAWFAPASPFTLKQEDGRVQEGKLTAQAHMPGVEAVGYHALEIDGQSLTIAVAPKTCYSLGMAGNTAIARDWGLTTQLYYLRRKGDGGIGDTQGLEAFVRAAGTRGACAVAISPVHAMFSNDSQRYSPYSPSSRLFLNALYAAPGTIL